MNWKLIKTQGTGNTTKQLGYENDLNKLYFMNEKVGFFGGDNSGLFIFQNTWQKTDRIKDATASYLQDGFVLHTKANADDEKVLILTEENPNGGINSQEIDQTAKQGLINGKTINTTKNDGQKRTTNR